MKNKLKQELKQAGKELKLVNKGKLTPRPVEEFLKELHASSINKHRHIPFSNS